MPIRSPQFKAGDKVQYAGEPATVIQKTPRGIEIRNRFGYVEVVAAKKLTKPRG